MQRSPILDGLLAALPTIRHEHAPSSHIYTLLEQVARREVEGLFDSDVAAEFGPFGELAFPCVNMGAADSLSLFDLDDLILFSFYWCNRRRYRRVLDIGANLGLHSLVMSRSGFEVRAFEPDPACFKSLQRNLAHNQCSWVAPVNAAVSRSSGTREFARAEAISPLLAWADLVKLDVEGQEAEILLATEADDWLEADGVVEIGNPANARAVFNHFRACGVRMFAQKQGWRLVENLSEMPVSCRDGSLFVTCRGEMPWAEPSAPSQRKAA